MHFWFDVCGYGHGSWMSVIAMCLFVSRNNVNAERGIAYAINFTDTIKTGIQKFVLNQNYIGGFRTRRIS